MANRTNSIHVTEVPPSKVGVQDKPRTLVSLRPSFSKAGETGAFNCPKCLRNVRAGSVSCPKCGLVFDLWEKGIARIPDMTTRTGDVDSKAEDLWQRIENNPEDEAGHEAFLHHCRDSGCLDLAAARYQAFLYQNPDSRTGRAFRERIILLAQFNRTSTSKAAQEPRRFTGVKVILLLCFFSLLMALMMTRNLMGH